MAANSSKPKKAAGLATLAACEREMAKHRVGYKAYVEELQDPEPETQECRGCGREFPYDLNADFCPACAAENAGNAPSGAAVRSLPAPPTAPERGAMV